MNIIDLMMQILPHHEPHDVPWFESFSYFEPADLDSEYMGQEAAKEKGAFIQALWTQYAIPKLYGADLGDFINFMVQLRSHVNTLKPYENIALGSAVDLVEQIRQQFDHLDLRDFPSLEPYAYLEPADLFHDYLEQEARKGKGAFIQAVWTVFGKPKLYNLVTKAWTEQSPQILTPWIHLAQMVLDGCYGQKWPDTVFQVPD
ncbi:hypothetical protein TNCV_4452551 [Trichonephila clavipes]|nr:hypothetical protein TNCV_4452551 [Trichonephila clavipes]